MSGVLLVRSGPDGDAAALRAAGLPVTCDPYLAITPCADAGAQERARRLLAAMSEGAWIACASSNGVRALVTIAGAEAVRSALSGSPALAVGPATARALELAGAERVLVPAVHTAEGMLDAIDGLAPASAALPRSAIGGTVLVDGLRARGWSVTAETVYDTVPLADPPSSAQALTDGRFDAIVLRSPSAVAAVAAVARIPHRTAVIAGGPTTAAAIRGHGLALAGVAADSTPEAVVAATLAAIGGTRG